MLLRSTWTLDSTTLGTQTITASAGTGVTVDFTATALAAAPDAITAEDGDAQTGTVGEPLTTDLQVLVKDTYGNVVEGATVTFTGDGTAADAVTDVNGLASSTWTLDSTTLGTQTITASAGTGVTVDFTARSEEHTSELQSH